VRERKKNREEIEEKGKGHERKVKAKARGEICSIMNGAVNLGEEVSSWYVRCEMIETTR
jgi:hypothetical protein